MSVENIRGQVRSGRWQRVFRGVYAPGGVDLDPVLRSRAALLSTGGSELLVGLSTAAELYGFGVVSDGLTHLVGPPGADHSPQRGLRVHAFTGLLTPTDVHGPPCVGADRCAIDLARSLPRLDAIAVLDAAVRSGRCTGASLAAELDRQAGRRGIIQARQLVDLVDGRAESPMESRLRLRVADGGLPTPEVQWSVSDGARERYRLDLAWPARRVGAEYDGAPAHLEQSQLRHDRARHNWLTSVAGWRLLYFTAQDVYRHPTHLTALLSAELAQPPPPWRRSRSLCG